MARSRGKRSPFYEYLFGPYTLGLNARKDINANEHLQLHDCARDFRGRFTARTKGWGLELAPRFLRALDGINPQDVTAAIETLEASRAMEGPKLVAALRWYLYASAPQPEYELRTLERQRDEAADLIEAIFYQRVGGRASG